jgi:thiamine biosynthesis lipoprotein
MRRRTFLLTAIAAAGAGATALPGRAATVVWRGTAMGGEAEIRLVGERQAARAALAEAGAEIARLERIFALQHPDGVLARLNREGRLAAPPLDLVAVLRRAAAWWRGTAGAFDPRVQPLWRALAEGRDPEAPRARLERAWDADVRVKTGTVALAPGAALTLNGIAQGTIADRVTVLLQRRGFAAGAVSAGETRLFGSDRRVVALPEIGVTLRLAEGALAVSRPGALLLPGGVPHILPLGWRRPDWSALAVLAPDAETADALSTACAAAGLDEAAAFVEGRAAALVGRSLEGKLRRLGDGLLLQTVSA